MDEMNDLSKKRKLDDDIVNDLASIQKWGIFNDQKANEVINLKHILGFNECCTKFDFDYALFLINKAKIMCTVCGTVLKSSFQIVSRHQSVNEIHLSRICRADFAVNEVKHNKELTDWSVGIISRNIIMESRPVMNQITLQSDVASQTIPSVTNSLVTQFNFQGTPPERNCLTTQSHHHPSNNSANENRTESKGLTNGKVEPTSETSITKASSAKRTKGVLSWDDYFMSVAYLSAMRSKDPSTQVGACIVNPNNMIVGIGYNGFPIGCSDDVLPWSRQADSELDTKYPYVCHAELNAILNKNCADLMCCRMYVGLFPCNECAKTIIQSRIAEVVYVSDKYYNTPKVQASRKMLVMAGVQLRQYIPRIATINIDFSKLPPNEK